MPRLSIGMPLYNNGRTLLRTLSSLQGQTFGDFRVVLSDDGSRDDTIEIAEEFAAHDSRFTLIRQPKNLNYGNFRFVLNAADTELFLFAPGDDWWEPTFIEKCIQALDADAGAVGAVTRVRFVDNGQLTKQSRGTAALVGSVAENLATYIREPSDNSRMYGVFRTSAAQSAFPKNNHFAFDWTFSAATLLFGTHVELSDALMERETTPTDKYIQYVRRDAGSALDRIIPLRAMTTSLLFEKRIPVTVRTLRALAAANLEMHNSYMRAFHPLYWKCFGWLLSRMQWRL